MEAYLLSVAQGRKGLVPTLLRGLLSALAPVYVAGLKAYLLPYNLGLRKRTRLACPVICVGNLTTGGTGKTPMVQTLCRLLTGQGLRLAILSRGYGGQNEYGCAVVSDAQQVLLTAEEAGDEAYLLAQTLPGIPVVVGKDRRVTGALAVERFQPDVIVMDDGMQFWQLHRDLDIALLNACAPFDNGWTFPRGLLREPPTHLRRSKIVVLTNTKRAGGEQVARVQVEAARFAPEARVFAANLAASGLRPVAGPEAGQVSIQTDIPSVSYEAGNEAPIYPLPWLAGRRVASLCALGNPESFERMLRDLGADLVTMYRFRDHQAISPTEMAQVFAEACAAGAEAVLTTRKDAVKMKTGTTPLPLLVLEVDMKIEAGEEAAFLQAVLAFVQPAAREKTTG